MSSRLSIIDGGFVCFENELTNVPTITKIGAGSGQADMYVAVAKDLAKANAKSEAGNLVKNTTPSYSSVQSGYGTKLSTSSTIKLGVDYRRRNPTSYTIINQQITAAGYDTATGKYYANATATASGTGQYVKRLTYHLLMELDGSQLQNIPASAIQEQILNVSIPDLGGNSLRLAIRKDGALPQNFIKPSDMGDYSKVDFSLSESGAAAVDITDLVKVMVQKGSYYLYLCLQDIPQSDSISTISTDNFSFADTEINKTPVTTVGPLVINDGATICVPTQSITLTWQNGLGGIQTAVSGYEVCYRDNSSAITVVGIYQGTTVEGLEPSQTRGVTRTFMVRALCEDSQYNGEYITAAIKTNQLPYVPQFTAQTSSGSPHIFAPTGQTNSTQYKRYWFSSAASIGAFSIVTASQLPSKDQDGQSLTYQYYVDDVPVSQFDAQYQISDLTLQGKVFKVSVSDGLEIVETTCTIYKNDATSVTINAGTPPYVDSSGRGYWIYFSTEPSLQGWHNAADCQFSWYLNDVLVDSANSLNNLSVLRQSNANENTVTLRVVVTDGADVSSDEIELNVPVNTDAYLCNTTEDSISGVDSTSFGPYLWVRRNDQQDSGVSILLGVGGLEYPITWSEQNGVLFGTNNTMLARLSRNQTHTLTLIHRWGTSLERTQSFDFYRVPNYTEYLNTFSLPLNTDGTAQIFSPYTDQSYHVIDGDGIPTSSASTKLKFQELSQNEAECKKIGISTNINQVFRIEIYSPNNYSNRIVLTGGDSGARLSFYPVSASEEIHLVTYENGQPLIDWGSYFSIINTLPINARLRVVITNLFGEEFYSEKQFQLNFSSDLLDCEASISIKLVGDNAYKTLDAGVQYPIFQGEYIRFNITAQSWYEQDIVAAIKIGNVQDNEIVLSLNDDQSTPIKKEYAANVDIPIQGIGEDAQCTPLIVLSAAGAPTSRVVGDSTTLPIFNLKRTNLNGASFIYISDILAERLIETGEQEYQGMNDAYRYTVSLGGDDFGGSASNTHTNFLDGAQYILSFSSTEEGPFSPTDGYTIVRNDWNNQIVFYSNIDQGTPGYEGIGSTTSLAGLTSVIKGCFIKIIYKVENLFEDPVFNLQDGEQIYGVRTHQKVLGTTKVFQLMPTVTYGANRIGVNVDNFDRQDSIVQINNSGEDKKIIYLKFYSEFTGSHVLYIDLEDGSLHGAVVDGGTWST